MIALESNLVLEHILMTTYTFPVVVVAEGHGGDAFTPTAIIDTHIHIHLILYNRL